MREAREVKQWSGAPVRDARGQSCRTRSRRRRPIVAATCYVRTYPQPIASDVEAPFTALGADGFGRSDVPDRSCATPSNATVAVIVAALAALASRDKVSHERVAEAISCYEMNANAETAPDTLKALSSAQHRRRLRGRNF